MSNRKLKNGRLDTVTARETIKWRHLLDQMDCDISSFEASGEDKSIFVTTPINGDPLANIKVESEGNIRAKVCESANAFLFWKDVPAPKRGELIRIFGNLLREYKEPLAQLVTLECGKIIEEGRGEVQEMIDICDFAVGLSRQLHGLTIASERKDHVMQENWLPLGPVGVISAFNFPVAVWAWNFALAIVCGDSVVWKPSEKTLITALACQSIFEKAVAEYGDVPEGLSQVIIGEAKAGEQLVNDSKIRLVSATGSTRMGGIVGPQVASRFGKCLLELGGNNAVIVSNKADLDLALPAILFGAVGTAGQRCTTTRRVFVHEDVADELKDKLLNAYACLNEKVGDPLNPDSLIGPLIDDKSFANMSVALDKAREQGGEVHFGQRLNEEIGPSAYYVHPALVFCDGIPPIVRQETFAPILYVMTYNRLDVVMWNHNNVPQGLSSAIFTTDVREAEYFKRNSDCGIANVNIGTSGAEIGGAFGGEKETGGGRESGSDAWKNYMFRQTSTTYYGTDVPELAQGIKFSV